MDDGGGSIVAHRVGVGVCTGSSRAFRPRSVATMSLAGLAFLQERRHITNLLCTPEGHSVGNDASSGTFARRLALTGLPRLPDGVPAKAN